MHTPAPHWLVWFLIFSPFVLWFVLEARVARLNKWLWGGYAILAIGLPLLGIRGFLQELLANNSMLTKLGGVLGLLAIAMSASIVVWVHKHFLKPKRVKEIGTSLSYVGGWLGTVILQLFASVGLSLFATFRELRAAFPEKPLTEMYSNVPIVSGEYAIGNGLYVLGLLGIMWAGVALVLKKPYAVQLAGYVAMLTFAAESFDTGGKGNFLYNVLWVGYLMRSRRVREVYGKNFFFPLSSTEEVVSKENAQA
jgi:hypothetical protein